MSPILAIHTHTGKRGGRFHEHIHACLRALAAKDGPGLAGHLRSARLGLLACLAQEVPSEPSRLLSPLLARLQSLRELEEAAALHFRRQTSGAMTGMTQSSSPSSSALLGAAAGRNHSATTTMIRKDEAEALLSSWRVRSKPLVDDFELVEPVSMHASSSPCYSVDIYQRFTDHASALSFMYIHRC